MSRQAVRALALATFITVAVSVVLLAWLLIVVAYVAAMMGAERASVALFAVSLVPVLCLGYGGRVFSEWWRGHE